MASLGIREPDRLPASAPLQEGLDEAYVRMLLTRNDEKRSLEEMLDEECLTVADLLRRKRRAEADPAASGWAWQRPKRIERLKRMAEGRVVGDDLYEEGELGDYRPGSIAARIKATNPALPRTPALCIWSGNDADENLYLCNSPAHVLHAAAIASAARASSADAGGSGIQRGRRLLRHCAYHLPVCCDLTHNKDVSIVSPNAEGLCFECYTKAHGGAVPVTYESPLLLPGVAFAADAMRRHPMAPPRYKTIAKKVVPPSKGDHGTKHHHHRRGSDAASVGTDTDTGSIASDTSSSGGDAAPGAAAPRGLLARMGGFFRSKKSSAAIAAAAAADAAAAAGDVSGDSMAAAAKAAEKAALKAAKAKRRAERSRAGSDLLARARAALSGKSLEEELEERRAAAVTVIQACVRQFQAVRAVDRVRRSRAVAERHAAAGLLQRNWRRILAQRRFKVWQSTCEAAAERIQRLWRRYAWRSKLVRDGQLRHASTRVQRWWRFMRVRWMLRLVKVRKDARMAALTKERPTDMFYKLTRLMEFRRKVRDVKRAKKVRQRAARIIQRAWAWYTFKPQTSVTARRNERAMLMLRGVIKMQKWMRGYFRRRHMRARRKELLVAARTIARLGRGFVARIRIKQRRARIEAVWQWLAPTMPRELIAEYLGFPDYDRMFRVEIARIKESTRDRNLRLATSASLAVAAATGNDLDANEIADVVARREAELLVPSQLHPWEDGMRKEDLDELINRDPRSAEAVLEARRHQRAQYERIGTVDLRANKTDKVGDRFKEEHGLNISIEDERRFENVMRRQKQQQRQSTQSKLVPMGRAHGPLEPSLESCYEPMLRTGRKPMPAPLLSATNGPTYKQRDAQTAHIARVESALRQADKEATGFLSSSTFERILSEAGLHAPPRLMRSLSSAFATTGGDRVKWEDFVSFCRRLDRPCPVHNILVCPACIYPGPCDKCICKRYSSSSDAMHSFLLLNPHTSVCLCGHLRARHAPAMTQHRDVALPAAVMPAQLLALQRITGLDPKVAALSGVAPMSVAPFGSRIFAPPPLTVTTGVKELHRTPDILELHDLVESGGGTKVGQGGASSSSAGPTSAFSNTKGISEDFDAGVGSLAYFSTKRHDATMRAAATGKGALDASMDESNFHLSMPHGVHGPPSTQVLRRLPTGACVGLNPIPADKFAALEALVMDIEATSSSKKFKSASEKGQYKPRVTPTAYNRDITADIPTALVSDMKLTDLSQANESLRVLVGMATNDSVQKLKHTRIAAHAAERAGRAAAQLSLPPMEPPPESVYDARLRKSGAAGSSAAHSAVSSALAASGSGNGVFWGSTASQLPPTAAPLFAEALKAGEALAAGAAAPSRAATESLMGRAVDSVKRGILREVEDADARKRHPPRLGVPSPKAVETALRTRTTRGAPVTLPTTALLNTGRPSDLAAFQPPPHPTVSFSPGTGTGRDSTVDTRPIAAELVGDLPERSASRALFTYLMLLRALSSPGGGGGYDILADPTRLSTLVLDHYSFLRVWWRDLLKDIRTGTLSGGPQGVLTTAQRGDLAAVLSPSEGRAHVLASLLTSLGFGRNRTAPQAAAALTPLEVAALKEPGRPMPAVITRERAKRVHADMVAAASEVEATERRRMLSIITDNLRLQAEEAVRVRTIVSRSGGRVTVAPLPDAEAVLDAFMADQRRGGRLLTLEQMRIRAPPKPSLGHYDFTAMLEPSKGVRSAYSAPAISGPIHDDVLSRRTATTAHRAALSSAVHAQGRTMAGGSGMPPTFLDNISRIFGGREAGAALLASSELFPHLALEAGGEGFALALQAAQEVKGVPEGGVGPLYSAGGLFLGWFYAAEGGHLEPLPEELVAQLFGGGGRGATEGVWSGMGGGQPATPSGASPRSAPPHQGAPDPPEDSSAFAPPPWLVSPPRPIEVIDRTGYSFYSIPGARPAACKFPGCGAVFGSVGAAIRHLKLGAHEKGVAPLNIDTPLDHYLAPTLKQQGIDGSAWLPQLRVPPRDKVLVKKALKIKLGSSGLEGRPSIAGVEAALEESRSVRSAAAGGSGSSARRLAR